MDQRTGQSTTIGQHLGHSAGKEDCFLLFASKTTCHLNQRLLRVLPSALPGEAYEPSPSRWLVRWTSRTPRKRDLLLFAAACVCNWAASGTECLLGHHVVTILRNTPKSQIASQKPQAELSYNCCFYAVLVLDWLLFPWVGGDGRTVTVLVFRQA